MSDLDRREELAAIRGKEEEPRPKPKPKSRTGRQDQGTIDTVPSVPFEETQRLEETISTKEVSKTLGIFKSAVESGRQSEEMQRQLDEARQQYVETLAIHESRLRDMKRNIGKYRKDGKPIIGRDIMAYERSIEEYKAGYQNYREQMGAGITQLQANKLETLTNMVNWRTETQLNRAEYAEKMDDYLHKVSEATGMATKYEGYEPTLRDRIPGPWGGPKPGSIGEKLQWEMQPRIKQGLAYAEKPFTRVTGSLRNAVADLDAKSQLDPGVRGFGMYAVGTALRVGAMGFDIATYEFRPGLWVQMGKTVGQLAFDPEARTAVANEALRDPFGFTAEIVGGAYLGGVLKQKAGVAASKVTSKVKRLWIESKTVPYSISPEAYYPAEYEMGLQFPEEVSGVKSTYRTFEKRWLKFEGKGEPVKGEMPYYGAKDVKTPGAEPKFDIPGDEWSIEKITSEADTAIPYEYRGEGGYLRVRGGYGGMKPFAEPKPPLPPRAEQLVVTAEAAPNTPIPSLVRQLNKVSLETELQFIPDIEAITAQRVGFKFITPETIKPPTVSLKFLDIKLLDIGKAATMSMSKVKSFDKVFTVPTISLRQIEQQVLDQLQRPEMVELPKIKQPQITGLTPTQIQTPEQTPIEQPRLDKIQIPTLDMPQITIPEIPEPEKPPEPTPPPLPIIIDPPGSRRIIIKGDLLSPKKKKKKKGRKGAFEFRVDFKEPKLPDIGDITFKEPKIKELKL